MQEILGVSDMKGEEKAPSDYANETPKSLSLMAAPSFAPSPTIETPSLVKNFKFLIIYYFKIGVILPNA